MLSPLVDQIQALLDRQRVQLLLRGLPYLGAPNVPGGRGGGEIALRRPQGPFEDLLWFEGFRHVWHGK